MLDGWFSGQWVWVNTGRWESEDLGVSSKYELGVIHDINETVNLFLAMDGKEIAIREDEILRVGLGFADLWGSKRTFQKFRDAAVNGYDTERLAIGAYEPEACIGVDVMGGKMRLVEPEFDAVHCGRGPRRLVTLGSEGKEGDCEVSRRSVSRERFTSNSNELTEAETSAEAMNGAKVVDGREIANEKLGEHTSGTSAVTVGEEDVYEYTVDPEGGRTTVLSC